MQISYSISVRLAADYTPNNLGIIINSLIALECELINPDGEFLCRDNAYLFITKTERESWDINYLIIKFQDIYFNLFFDMNDNKIALRIFIENLGAWKKQKLLTNIYETDTARYARFLLKLSEPFTLLALKLNRYVD